MSLGDEIRTARQHLGLNQAQAAERLGVTADTVSNWERGIVNPAKRMSFIRERLAVTQDTDQAGDSPRLTEATDAQLLGEIAARFARTARSLRPGEPYRWRTADGPRAKRRDETTEEDEPDTRKA